MEGRVDQSDTVETGERKTGVDGELLEGRQVDGRRARGGGQGGNSERQELHYGDGLVWSAV